MKTLKYIALIIGAFALFVFGTNKVIEVNRAAKINERFAADSEVAVFSATSKTFTEDTYFRGRRRSAGIVYRADLTYTTADGRTVNVSGVPISTGERDSLNFSNEIQCLYLKSDTQQVLCKGGAEMNESSSYTYAIMAYIVAIMLLYGAYEEYKRDNGKDEDDDDDVEFA